MQTGGPLTAQQPTKSSPHCPCTQHSRKLRLSRPAGAPVSSPLCRMRRSSLEYQAPKSTCSGRQAAQVGAVQGAAACRVAAECSSCFPPTRPACHSTSQSALPCCAGVGSTPRWLGRSPHAQGCCPGSALPPAGGGCATSRVPGAEYSVQASGAVQPWACVHAAGQRAGPTCCCAARASRALATGSSARSSMHSCRAGGRDMGTGIGRAHRSAGETGWHTQCACIPCHH
jgi:hypothetical protein